VTKYHSFVEKSVVGKVLLMCIVCYINHMDAMCCLMQVNERAGYLVSKSGSSGAEACELFLCSLR
jgi:hypothetical protein